MIILEIKTITTYKKNNQESPSTHLDHAWKVLILLGCEHPYQLVHAPLDAAEHRGGQATGLGTWGRLVIAVQEVVHVVVHGYTGPEWMEGKIGFNGLKLRHFFLYYVDWSCQQLQ